MSDMFDPKKLDLDFSDDNENNKKSDQNQDKKPQNKEEKKQNAEIKKAEDKIKQIEKSVESEAQEVRLREDLSKAKQEEEKPKQETSEEKKSEDDFNIDVFAQLEQPEEEEKKDEEREIKNKEVSPEMKKFYKQVPEIEKKQEKVMDQSIKTLEDLIDILYKKKYAYFTIIPSEQLTEINFKTDNKLEERRYISYKVYASILMKLKWVWKFDLEIDDEEQKKEFEMNFKEQKIKILAKTAPSKDWEKIFLKPKKTVNKTKANIKKEPISITKILWFLAVLLLVVLIILWAFLTFVVMNAKTPADVAVFSQLWINLSEINTFIKNTILLVFTILAFVESVILWIFVFRAILTKKKYKRKRVFSAFVSVFMFIILIWTASLWLALYRKKLPDWYQISLWAIQIYDNDKLINDNFTPEESALRSTSDIIWPITLKYDLTNFYRDKAQDWFVIQRYIWDFWDKKKVETIENSIIKEFNKKWLYDIKLTIEWEKDGEFATKIVDDIKPVNISSMVEYSETVLPNWWKRVKFDATDLKPFGQIKWYFEDTPRDKAPMMYIFQPWEIFMEDTFVWMKIIRAWEEADAFDKIFFIKWASSSDIWWRIDYKRSIMNDLEFTFKAKNPQIAEWNWFVSKFEWVFWDDIKTVNNIDITSEEAIEESSEVKYIFKNYWTQKVSLRIYDSSGNFREITENIEIPILLQFREPIWITVDWEELESKKIYNSKLREYTLEWIWAPSTIHLNARKVKPIKNKSYYKLISAKWDTDGDWNFDKTWKEIDLEIPLEGLYNVWVELTFVHLRDIKKKIEMVENINIDAIKKEAILKLDIEKTSEYVPVTVKFDASKSEVDGENIVKFIYDYGDGRTEERDAVNPWHRYTQAWDYTVKLTVVTQSWKQYSMSKKLILKPKPQEAKITSSFKEASVWQSIAFSSEKSEWQIESYVWKFGDWKVSSEASPNHTYTKSWEYEVLLRITFTDRNVIEDKYIIKITD